MCLSAPRLLAKSLGFGMGRHLGRQSQTSTVCSLGMGSSSLSETDSELRRMKEGKEGGARDA